MISELVTDPGALRRAVNGEVVSTAGAWAGGHSAVEGFLRRIVADLDRLPRLIVHHAEFRHYGSGYASYIDVFLTKRDGSMRRSVNGWTDVEGVSLALCRLAPLAVLFAPSERSSGPNGAGVYSLPEFSRVADTDPPGWEQECRQVSQVLDRHDIVLLGSPVLGLPLNQRLQVDTVIGDPPYKVFDAWFH